MIAFHPSVYIQEELEARGWTREQFAARLAIARGHVDDCAVEMLAVDLYFEIGAHHPEIILGRMLEDYARVLGVSPELLRNLETRWQASQRVQ